MSGRLICAESLRQFAQQAFLGLSYSEQDAADAADVLMWASVRGVDTHGVRNLKPYYVDRTLSGELKPQARADIQHETLLTATLDGNSGLGLVGARRAMELAIEKARLCGVGIVCVRNTHHLGPAGYYAHMAVDSGMLGMCATGHFFGEGHCIGVAPPGTILPMFSTNPLSFAAPCGKHAPFLLDMATAAATVNRIEMHAQDGRPIPIGWARDILGNPTTDPNMARVLTPLGGTAELGGCKGAGLSMMVSIVSGVLSGSWSTRRTATIGDTAASTPGDYTQETMGHVLAAVRVDLFQPLDQFQSAMDAMIDALHAAPREESNIGVCYPGEIESATAAERAKSGIPVDHRLVNELRTIAQQLGIEMPQEITTP